MTKAADVYSFGMLMWELVTGKKLFDGLRQSQVRFHCLPIFVFFLSRTGMHTSWRRCSVRRPIASHCPPPCLISQMRPPRLREDPSTRRLPFLRCWSRARLVNCALRRHWQPILVCNWCMRLEDMRHQVCMAKVEVAGELQCIKEARSRRSADMCFVACRLSAR